MNRYLLSSQPPPPGTVCQPDLVPFAQPAAAARTAAQAGRALLVAPLVRRGLAG